MRAIVAVALLLTGCQTACPLPELPKVVKVPVVHYVAVPEELTRPCPTDKANEQTYAEAKRLAMVRRQIIIDCDHADKAKIRALGEAAP